VLHSLARAVKPSTPANMARAAAYVVWIARLCADGGARLSRPVPQVTVRKDPHPPTCSCHCLASVYICMFPFVPSSASWHAATLLPRATRLLARVRGSCESA
jgi:hypothetical protein